MSYRKYFISLFVLQHERGSQNEHHQQICWKFGNAYSLIQYTTECVSLSLLQKTSWHDQFPAFMSHVGLSFKENRLNFHQWSSTFLISYFEAISPIFDEPMTYFSDLLVSLWIRTDETKDNVSRVHLLKLLMVQAKN